MKGLVLSVSQLNDYVRKSLASDPMLRQICLSGGISNFKGAVSGHWYFSLKDEDAAISCVMFRQAAAMVRAARAAVRTWETQGPGFSLSAQPSSCSATSGVGTLILTSA